jgi:diguanylate cyclase (GGDEF)-like protein/PAS domain S-box-containing protein
LNPSDRDTAMTDEHRAADEVWRRKRHAHIVENIKDVLWELDARLVFTYISPQDREQRGYDPHEVIGQHLFTFLTDASQSYVLKATSDYVRSSPQGSFTSVTLPDVQQICKDGRTIWTEITINPVIENGVLAAFVGITRDISERKSAEAKLREYAERLEQLDQQLKRLTTADKLTRVIFNRDKLERIFNEELNRARRYKIGFSLEAFNVDSFKRINEVYGNLKGDDVLAELEGAVTLFIRDHDSVFRRGGDEFIMLLPHTSGAQAQAQAERLRQAIEQRTFSIQEKVTISIGATEYVYGDSLETMLQRVDTALYLAKRGGHNQVMLR